MAGILNLSEVLEKKGQNFIYDLLNKKVIVNEKMDFSAFSFNKTNESIKYFKKDKEITKIDRVISKFYEPAINYIEGLSEEIKLKLPHNFIFGTEYCPSNKLQESNYDEPAKNNLILSHIHILKEDGTISQTIQDKDQLIYWSNILGIEEPPIVFQGNLNSDQKSKILEFANTPHDKLLDKFKTQSFSKYILSVLNPEMKRSFLRKDLGQIEGLVFRFSDENNENITLAKIIDPLFRQIKLDKAKDKVNESADYVYLILIDLMNYIESTDFNKIFLDGTTFDERYLGFCNHIFNEFIKEYGDKYAGIIIDTPAFLKKQDFQINYDQIKDLDVIDNLKKNENFQEIYRILLNFFRKKRKKPSGKLFDRNILIQFNSLIDKINVFLRKNEIYENYFPLFNEYVNSEVDEDSIKPDKYIDESFDINITPSKQVNILVGRFQPFHLGHLKSLQLLQNKNNLSTVIFCVKGDKPNTKSPFDKSVQTKIFSKIKENNPGLIEEVFYTKRGWIEDLLKTLRPKYEPILWGAGDDRLNSYKLQTEYAKNKKIDLNLNKNFKLFKLPRYTSGTDVRKSIEENNYEQYKKLMPEYLHGEFPYFYREIQNLLSGISNSVLENNQENTIKPIQLYDSLMNNLKHLLNESESIENWKQIVNTPYNMLTEDQKNFYNSLFKN